MPSQFSACCIWQISHTCHVLYHLNISDDDLIIVSSENTKKKEKESNVKASKSKPQQKQESPKLKPASDVSFFCKEPDHTKEKTPKRKKVCKSDLILITFMGPLQPVCHMLSCPLVSMSHHSPF